MYNLYHVWLWLRHRPLGIWMAAASGLLGVAVLIVLWHFDRAGQYTIERNLLDTDLIIGAKGSPLQLVLCGLYHADAPTGNIPLQAARPYLSGKHPIVGDAVVLSLGDSYKGYRLVGTDTTLLRWYGVVPVQGRHWQQPMEIVAGSEVARALRIRIGDSLLSNHGLVADTDMHHEAHPFTVVGILPPTGLIVDRLLLTAKESYWHTHHDHDTTDSLDLDVTMILCRYKARNAAALNLAANINRNTDYQAAVPAIEMNRLYLQLGQGVHIVRLLGWLMIAVSVMTMLLALLTRLYGRRSELQLLRLLGASPTRLLVLTLLEGVGIALISVLSGMVLGHVALALLSLRIRQLPLDPLSMHANEWWLIPGAVCVGMLAALWPAWQAYRTDIQLAMTEAR